MPQPSIRVRGAYQLPITATVIEDALQTWYGTRLAGFSDDQRSEVEREIRQELGPTVLLDVELREVDERFSVDHFGQPGSDQAPYDERFLDLETGAVIGQSFERPPTPSFRVAFYLHRVNPTQPLTSSYGSLVIPPIRAMPDDLWRVMPYRVWD